MLDAMGSTKELVGAAANGGLPAQQLPSLGYAWLVAQGLSGGPAGLFARQRDLSSPSVTLASFRQVEPESGFFSRKFCDNSGDPRGCNAVELEQRSRDLLVGWLLGRCLGCPWVDGVSFLCRGDSAGYCQLATRRLPPLLRVLLAG